MGSRTLSSAPENTSEHRKKLLALWGCALTNIPKKTFTQRGFVKLYLTTRHFSEDENHKCTLTHRQICQLDRLAAGRRTQKTVRYEGWDKA